MANVIYEWTGIFKVPRWSEYFLNADNQLKQATVSFVDNNSKRYFLLRRVEAGEVDDGK